MKNVEASVKLAIKRGELMPRTPARTLALMLIAIINSSDPTTRDTSSFKRMEELYLGYLELVVAAYGRAGR